MKRKATRNGGRKFAEPLLVPVTEDDLDAMKLISAILGQFGPDDRERIMRYVAEKYAIGGQAAVLPKPVLETYRKEAKRVRNPHEMSKPPLNKLIMQDDDDEGMILGVPADRDIPEPPDADILKPKAAPRKLITVEDVHKSKDGSKTIKSRSLLMAG